MVALDLQKRNLRKEDDKRFNSIISCTVKCNCGHSVVLASVDRALCSWCGNYVYKDKQTEFKYLLKREMIKNGK